MILSMRMRFEKWFVFYLYVDKRWDLSLSGLENLMLISEWNGKEYFETELF